ncbi:pyridoxamine 5'-phosphate oxidase family protein [Streptantibioticus rubrisoli]|uniref:Pyridoxamine 5'-phosphate oxidase family protein n=1 Tax=Streptantibioticus rubrisoli TaxID=1387313 RepID=A0ABT1PAB1_9ACTN|nr:pyridoxamine 5'-phosphate oxidase family protein [Streptantibioticus rubrisoli]MCQ4042312.1 pyridoxamine 5'-phosphate oxidase family protein [Streptantibioticus rubrisoli]
MGRVSLNTADGLVIMPVNYTMDIDVVAFRTTYDHSLAAADGTEVAFEVDRIDEAPSQGGSVLVVGGSPGSRTRTPRSDCPSGRTPLPGREANASCGCASSRGAEPAAVG